MPRDGAVHDTRHLNSLSQGTDLFFNFRIAGKIFFVCDTSKLQPCKHEAFDLPPDKLLQTCKKINKDRITSRELLAFARCPFPHARPGLPLGRGCSGSSF